jgi:hypothetical protein
MNIYTYSTYFTKPELRKNFYISKSQQPIIENIIDAKLKKITKLNCNKGYILTFYLNNIDKTIFNTIDDNAVNMLISNNKIWFNNNLSTDDIIELFKKSVCEQTNIINIIVNENSKIYMNDKICSLEELLARDMTYFRKCMMNIKVQHIGLYIYAKQSLNRWYASSMNMYDEDIEIEDKEDIEKSWGNLVEESDAVLENKINSLENTRIKIKTLYSDICKNRGPNELNGKIQELKKLIQNIIF